MKLLLDQGLPRSTVKQLTDAGVACEHVGELGMARATDEAILLVAESRQAVVVTLDADFHRLLAVFGARSPSVIRIRIEGLNGNQLAVILQKVMAAADKELANGAAVSVSQNRIRVRTLPLRS